MSHVAHRASSVKGRLALPVAFVLIVAGCAGGASPSSAPSAVPPTASAVASPASAAAGAVKAALSEFKMVLDTTSAPAGSVTFKVTNDGKIDHEFVVFKTDLAADKLPLTADGTKVDEGGKGVTHIDEVAEFGPGKTETLTVNLAAGHYVLICNVPSHYTKGIHAEFSTK